MERFWLLMLSLSLWDDDEVVLAMKWRKLGALLLHMLLAWLRLVDLSLAVDVVAELLTTAAAAAAAAVVFLLLSPLSPFKKLNTAFLACASCLAAELMSNSLANLTTTTNFSDQIQNAKSKLNLESCLTR